MLDWSEIILRLGIATLAGGAIGLNRDLHGKPIGLKTRCSTPAPLSAARNLLLTPRIPIQSVSRRIFPPRAAAAMRASAMR